MRFLLNKYYKKHELANKCIDDKKTVVVINNQKRQAIWHDENWELLKVNEMVYTW